MSAPPAPARPIARGEAVGDDNTTSPDASTNDRVNAAPITSVDVPVQLSRMKDEIDSLQMVIAEKSKPWYKQTATLIAIAALFLSFITTVYSEMRAHQQDVNSDRQELSALIQRLTAIPRDETEFRLKYRNNQTAAVSLSGQLQEEQVVLAKRAAEIVDRLPSEKVSSAEYLAIAGALESSGVYDRSLEMIQRGIPASKDANELIGLLRTNAALLYDMGDYRGGDAKFQEALDAFKKFPVKVTWYVESAQANTEIIWAESAISHRLCQEGRVHSQRAADHLSRATDDRWGVQSRLKQLRVFVRDCRSISTRVGSIFRGG